MAVGLLLGIALSFVVMPPGMVAVAEFQSRLLVAPLSFAGKADIAIACDSTADGAFVVVPGRNELFPLSASADADMEFSMLITIKIGRAHV